MKNFDKQMEMVLYHSDEGDVSVDAYIMNPESVKFILHIVYNCK